MSNTISNWILALSAAYPSLRPVASNDTTRLLPAPKQDYPIDSGFITSGESFSFVPTDQEYVFEVSTKGIGHQSIQKEIYPLQSFDYTIFQQGQMPVYQHDHPYAMELIAYPRRSWTVDLTVQSLVTMPISYRLNCNIGARAEIKTLEYAIEAKGEITTDKTDISIQSLSGGTKVGSTTGAVFSLNNNQLKQGSGIDENKNVFYGIIEPTKSISKGEIVFEYEPLTFSYSENGKTYSNCKDDDLIGFIFRAENEQNFYVLFIEGQESIFKYNSDSDSNYSARFSNEFLKTEIAIQETQQYIWTNNNQWIQSAQAYINNQDYYRTTAGWGSKHHKLFRVQDGKIKQINATFNHSVGWSYDQTNRVKFVFDGKKISIYLNDLETPTIAFETETENGGYGICNFSQPVSFQSITAKTYQSIQKREPETGFYTYNGIGETTKNDVYQTGLQWANALLSPLANQKTFQVTSISAVRKYTTFGSAKITLSTPLKLHADNYTDAQNINETFSKNLTAIIEPEYDSEKTAKLLIADAEDFFLTELEQFKKQNPLLKATNPTFSITNATSGVMIKLVNQKVIAYQLQTNVNIRRYVKTISAARYESWVEVINLADYDLEPGSKITYSIQNEAQAYQPSTDAFIWGKSGSTSKETVDETEVLLVSTTALFVPVWKQKANRGTLKGNQKRTISFQDILSWKTADQKTKVTPQPNWEIACSFYSFTAGMKCFYHSNPKMILIAGETGAIYDQVKNKSILITKQYPDQLTVYQESILDYVLYESKKLSGSSSVNGLIPYTDRHQGKTGGHSVSFGSIVLPKEVKDIKTIVQCSNPLVTYQISGTSVIFDSMFKQPFEIRKPFETEWVFNPQGFIISGNQEIECNPLDYPSFDQSIEWTHIVAKSSHPFVQLKDEYDFTTESGVRLIESTIQKPATTTNQSWLVSPNAKYYERSIRLTKKENEFIDVVYQRYASDFHMPVTVSENELSLVTTIQLTEDTAELKVAIRSLTIEDPLKDYVDLNIEAPNGELFGFRYRNQTYHEDGLINQTGFDSCSRYDFSGPDLLFEEMKFKDPIIGDWKIYVDNPTSQIQGIEYFVSIGEIDNEYVLPKDTDLNSIRVKINGVLTEDVAIINERVMILIPMTADDLIEIAYQIQTGFEDPVVFDLQQNIALTSVTIEGISIINSNQNGYTFINGVFRLFGAAAQMEGMLVIGYFIGTLNRSFLIQSTQLSKRQNQLVYHNDQLLNETDYVIENQHLLLDDSIIVGHQDRITLILVFFSFSFWEKEILGTRETIQFVPNFSLIGTWSDFQNPVLETQSTSFEVNGILKIDHTNSAFDLQEIPISFTVLQPVSETSRLVRVLATNQKVSDFIVNFDTLSVALGETGWNIQIESDVDEWSFSSQASVKQTSNVHANLYVELLALIRQNPLAVEETISDTRLDLVEEKKFRFETPLTYLDETIQTNTWYELRGKVKIGKNKKMKFRMTANVPAIFSVQWEREFELVWSNNTSFGTARWTYEMQAKEDIESFVLRFLPNQDEIQLFIQIEQNNQWISIPDEMIILGLNPIIKAKIDPRFQQFDAPTMGFEMGASYLTKYIHLPNASIKENVLLTNGSCQLAVEGITEYPILVQNEQNDWLRLSMHLEDGALVLGEQLKGVIYHIDHLPLPHPYEDIDPVTLVIKINNSVYLSANYLLSMENEKGMIQWIRKPNIYDEYIITYRLKKSFAYQWNGSVCQIDVHDATAKIHVYVSESKDPSMLTYPIYPWMNHQNSKLIVQHHVSPIASYALWHWVGDKRLQIQLKNEFHQPVANTTFTIQSSTGDINASTDQYGYAIIKVSDDNGWIVSSGKYLSAFFRNEKRIWDVSMDIQKEKAMITVRDWEKGTPDLIQMLIKHGQNTVFGFIYANQPVAVPLGNVPYLLEIRLDANTAVIERFLLPVKG